MKSGPLRAIGKVIHCGRQLATAEARIVGADGKLYAHGTTTCLVFAARRALIEASARHWITSSARSSSDCGIVRPKRLGRLQVDHELEHGRLLDRQISRDSRP